LHLDPAWYAYSAATNHITSDLDKLTTKENYGGQEQVHASNGAGMMIKHIDHSMVSTPSRPIHLNNVLHLDPAWYAYSAATNHITSDLDKLTTKENYGGQEQVHASNGAGMMIKHIDHSIVSTPSRPIHLNNVLHVPQATRNLAYVHHLTSDNECFLELHPTFFLVKDQHTRHTLLHSHCRNDLYPIPPVVPSSTKLFLPTAKPSTLEWHGRLGHPYFKIVSRVLQFNKLPFVSNKQSGTHICDACQQAKSH
jgi:hypothetical protein